jgi:hypothetical protein
MMPTESPLPELATARFTEIGRQLAALGYTIGKWTLEIRHVDPCDCDEDEEQAGGNCLANSVWYWALFRDEGAHGWSFAYRLSANHLPQAVR